VKHCISEVEFEEDAFDVPEDSEKSECELPEEVVEKWIHRGKGTQLYDTVDEDFLFLHQKTVVVTDYSPRRDTWIVEKVFRSHGFDRKQGLDRYSEVAPGDFKESRRQSQ
jgi:ribosomal protein S16